MNYKEFDALAQQNGIVRTKEEKASHVWPAKIEDILPVTSNISIEDIIKLGSKVAQTAVVTIDGYPLVDRTELYIASAVTGVSLFTGLTLEDMNTFEAYEVILKYDLEDYVESHVGYDKMLYTYAEEYAKFIEEQHTAEFILNKHLTTLSNRLNKTLDNLDAFLKNSDFSTESYDKLLDGLKGLGSAVEKADDAVSAMKEEVKQTKKPRKKTNIAQ